MKSLYCDVSEVRSLKFEKECMQHSKTGVQHEATQVQRPRLGFSEAQKITNNYAFIMVLHLWFLVWTLSWICSSHFFLSFSGFLNSPSVHIKEQFSLGCRMCIFPLVVILENTAHVIFFRRYLLLSFSSMIFQLTAACSKIFQWNFKVQSYELLVYMHVHSQEVFRKEH